VRIGLLTNLTAGRHERRLRRVLDAVAEHPHVEHVRTTSVIAVPDALARLARRDVELLIVNGGDGTLQNALTSIFRDGAFDGRTPLLAPLRGGRTNMTALDLGARRDTARAVRELLRDADRGELADRVTHRRVLRVDLGPGAPAQYGMFFGLGVIHRSIELVHQSFPQGKGQGVAGATALTSALLARAAVQRLGGIATPDKLHIVIDGEEIEGGEFMLGMATSLHRLFAGMRPFWGVGEGGVRFTAVRGDVRRVAWSAPGILAGRPNRSVREDAGFVSRNARAVLVRMDCGTTIDGELTAPEPGRVVALTADDSVPFVRA